MLELFSIIYAILIIMFAGMILLFIKPFSLRNEQVGAMLPFYFITGLIVLSLYMFLLFCLKIKFTIFNVSFPIMILAAYAIYKGPKKYAARITEAKLYLKSLFLAFFNKKNIVFSGLIILLIIMTSIIFLQNLILPPFLGDSCPKWFFKPKMIFLNRTMPADLLTNPYYYYTCQDYPLLAPLNMAWAAICIGAWREAMMKSFFSLIYLSMMIYYYYSLKKYIKPLWALAGTAIIFLLPNMTNAATNGYADIVVSLFVTASAISFFNWLEDEKNNEYLLLSAFFIGGAAWTKNDGFAQLAAILTTLLILFVVKYFKKEWGIKFIASRLVAFIAMAGIVFAPFKIFTIINGMKNHMISGPSQILSVYSNLWRAPYILNQFFNEFIINTNRWLYFWIFFFIIVFINRARIARTNLKYLLIFIFLVFAALFGVFMIRNCAPGLGGFLKDVEELERLLLSIAPTAGFLLFLAAFWDRNGQNNISMEK